MYMFVKMQYVLVCVRVCISLPLSCRLSGMCVCARALLLSLSVFSFVLMYAMICVYRYEQLTHGVSALVLGGLMWHYSFMRVT